MATEPGRTKAAGGVEELRLPAWFHPLSTPGMPTLVRWEEGVRAARSRLESGPAGHDVWEALAMALEDVGRWGEAVEAYRAALEARSCAKCWTNIGADLCEADAEGEEEAYREALAVDPGYAPAWSNLGWVLADREDLDGAREAFLRATEIAPERVGGWHRLGRFHCDRREWEAAAAALAKALEVSEGGSPASAYSLGWACLMVGDVAEAGARFGKTLGSVGRWLNAEEAGEVSLALALAQGMAGEEHGLMASTGRLLESHPGEAWYVRGAFFRERGKVAEAAEAYRRCAETPGGPSSLLPDFDPAGEACAALAALECR